MQNTRAQHSNSQDETAVDPRVRDADGGRSIEIALDDITWWSKTLREVGDAHLWWGDCNGADANI